MARRRSEADRGAAPTGRFPGLREGVPLLVIGSAAVALGVYSLATGLRYGPTHFPIWTYLLALGGIAFIGGTVTTFVGSPVPTEHEGWSLPADSVVVDRMTWERLSHEVARYRASGAAPGIEKDPRPGAEPTRTSPPRTPGSVARDRAAELPPSRRPRLFARPPPRTDTPDPAPAPTERKPAPTPRASRFAGLMLAVGPAANQTPSRTEPSLPPWSEPRSPPSTTPRPEVPAEAAAASEPPVQLPKAAAPESPPVSPTDSPPLATASSSAVPGPGEGASASTVVGTPAEVRDSFDKLFLELGEEPAAPWKEGPAPTPGTPRAAPPSPAVCVGCGRSFVALAGQRCDSCGLPMCAECEGRSESGPNPGLCPTCRGLLETAGAA